MVTPLSLISLAPNFAWVWSVAAAGGAILGAYAYRKPGSSSSRRARYAVAQAVIWGASFTIWAVLQTAVDRGYATLTLQLVVMAMTLVIAGASATLTKLRLGD